MNNSYNVIINELKQNISELITLYKEEARINKKIRNEILIINEELHNYKKKYEIAEKNYERLKMAKSLTNNSDSSHESKKKLNEIIREIDNCIALLNK